MFSGSSRIAPAAMSLERESLLKEYEETITKQSSLIRKQQDTIEALQDEISRLQEEFLSTNKQNQSQLTRLTADLENLTAQAGLEEAEGLRRSLANAVKERELIEKEKNQHVIEVQRLQQELQRRGGISHALSGPPTSTLPVEYAKVVTALEEETQRLRSELISVDEAKVDAEKEIIILSKKLTQLEERDEQYIYEISALKKAVAEKDKIMLDMKSSFEKLDGKFEEQKDDMKTLMVKTEVLQKSKARLNSVVIALQEKLKEAEIYMMDSIRVAEDAVAEKDAALLREKHAQNEIRRLEGSVNGVMEEAGQKTKAEVSKIKDDYNNSIKSLSQEILKLEMETNKKTLECEKCYRDLKKAEAEVERLQTELQGIQQESEQGSVLFLKRISDLESRISLLTLEKETLITQHEKSRKHYSSQNEELAHRIQQLEERLAVVRDQSQVMGRQYIEIVREKDYLDRSLKETVNNFTEKERTLQRQIRQKIEEAEEVERSLNFRLEKQEESHELAVSQLFTNLESLQENNSKLQNQLSEQRKEYEENLGLATSAQEDYKAKIRQLESSLQQATTQLAIAEDQKKQYKTRVEEVQNRLKQVEKRFTTLRQNTSGHVQLESGPQIAPYVCIKTVR
ncbi:uncharacterized protein LOC143025217 [Oratosquilla oratoria]|uniref:uncharacterized protein LOC143025217 n=1 Tax=Oratosquilla oratoria TaxID=337810 RepID=UPI003F770C60